MIQGGWDAWDIRVESFGFRAIASTGGSGFRHLRGIEVPNPGFGILDPDFEFRGLLMNEFGFEGPVFLVRC